MDINNKYIYFCSKFYKYRLPKLRFKELNQWDKSLYNNLYKIGEDEVNKASFYIF